MCYCIGCSGDIEIEINRSKEHTGRKNMKMFLVLIAVLFVAVESSVAVRPPNVLRIAIRQQESSDGKFLKGDKKLKNPAFGPYQVRAKAMIDYNRWKGTNYSAEDCTYNEELSLDVFNTYIDHYATEKRLGHKPTMKEMAGIWNGGPNGWKSADDYWGKVSRYLPREFRNV